MLTTIREWNEKRRLRTMLTIPVRRADFGLPGSLKKALAPTAPRLSDFC